MGNLNFDISVSVYEMTMPCPFEHQTNVDGNGNLRLPNAVPAESHPDFPCLRGETDVGTLLEWLALSVAT